MSDTNGENKKHSINNDSIDVDGYSLYATYC